MADESTSYQFKTADEFLTAHGYQPQKPFTPSVDTMMGNQPENSNAIGELEPVSAFQPRYPTGPTHSFAPVSNRRIEQICATCPNDYSIAFEVRDADNRLCAGMYYTVWCDAKRYFHHGITDENGLTERYVSPDGSDRFFLYLGHRDREKDGYPRNQNDAPHAAENKVDEAPLWSDKVMYYSQC